MFMAIAPYPNVVQEALAAAYGPPARLRDVPLTTQAAVERQFLADTLQDYDQNIPLEHDEFIGDLMRQGGLLGLGLDVPKPVGTDQRVVWQRCNQQCTPQTGALRGKCVRECVRGMMPVRQVRTRRPIKPALLGLGAETITRTIPEPTKASTIYLVMGGAAILLAGSIALWWFSKK